MNKDVTCAKSRKKYTAALAKARAANASWGTGAAEDFERPFSGIKSRTATPNLKKIVEDALEEEEEEDAESKGGASDAKGQDDDEDKDDDYDNDAASRRDSVFSEVRGSRAPFLHANMDEHDSKIIYQSTTNHK
jgi:hypothetical protein